MPKFQTLGRKAGIPHTLYHLYQQFRHSEPLLSSGNSETPFPSPCFQMPATGHLANRPSEEGRLSSLLALFHAASQRGWRKDGISTLFKLMNISWPGHLLSCHGKCPQVPIYTQYKGKCFSNRMEDVHIWETQQHPSQSIPCSVCLAFCSLEKSTAFRLRRPGFEFQLYQNCLFCMGQHSICHTELSLHPNGNNNKTCLTVSWEKNDIIDIKAYKL